jgi:hypothetical protein
MAGQGDKLRAMIDAAGFKLGKVSTACGVTEMTVRRWIIALNKDSIDQYKWRKFSSGLRKLGLDPSLIREVPPELKPNQELLPLLELFPDVPQLEALEEIITATEPARDYLLALIKDRLRRAE